MRNKQDKTIPRKNADTVIGEGIILKDALLTGGGAIRIDGRFSGTIEIEGHLVLGEKGFLKGNVNVGSAVFAGNYSGNIRVRDTMHVTATAVLSGTFETGKLIIDKGATLNGTCNVTAAGNEAKAKTDTEAGAELKTAP